MTSHEHGDACETCIPPDGHAWLERKVAAQTLEAILTRNVAHVYGLDGYAAQVIARERLAAFDAFAAGHVPVFVNLQRIAAAFRAFAEQIERAFIKHGDAIRRAIPAMALAAELVHRQRPPEPSWVAFTDRPERQRRRR